MVGEERGQKINGGGKRRMAENEEERGRGEKRRKEKEGEERRGKKKEDQRGQGEKRREYEIKGAEVMGKRKPVIK